MMHVDLIIGEPVARPSPGGAAIAAEPLRGHQTVFDLFSKVAGLNLVDRSALSALPHHLGYSGKDTDIPMGGSKPAFLGIVLEGLGAAYNVLEDGRSQIVSFLIPGDIVSHPSLVGCGTDHPTVALASTKIGWVPISSLKPLIRSHGRVAEAFWSAALVDASISRQWLVNLGRRSAEQRMAHLFCELRTRLQGVGGAAALDFPLPITQHQLADALSLSDVHVNRTLQTLRAKQMIVFDHGRVAILDWERLSGIAEFDPSYLKLQTASF